MARKYFLLILIGIIGLGANAATISKVKGSGALIDLQGEAAAPGDQFFAMSADGKRKALISISKVKGDKAIGKIEKGNAAAGMSLQHKGASGDGATPSNKKVARKKGATSATETAAHAKSYWGVMAGFSMDKMSVLVKPNIGGFTEQTTSLSGSSFSGNAFFDYELFPQVWFRGLGGIEGFNVSGSSICGVGNSEACTANIYYLSVDFIARYIFVNTGTFRPWLGGGLAMMFPATKKASALEPSSISNTNVIQVMGGADVFVNQEMFIPFSVEYGMLPKSNEVDASWIQVRLGLGIPF